MTTSFGLVVALLAGFTVPALAAPAHQGYLGVDVRDVTPDEVPGLKLKDAHGAEIVLVDHDAPAGKCGLREHDVVLMMDGQPIDGQDQLRRMLHDSPPGKSIVLIVSHDGQQRAVNAQMAVSQEDVERQAAEQRLTVPEPQDQPAQSLSLSPEPSMRGGNTLLGPLVMNPSYTGLYLEKMSTQLAGFFGVPGGSGLLVRSVQENSPAALAGIQAGDVVVRANSKTITNTGEWAKAIKNSQGRALSIVIIRDKREQTLTLTPDGKKRASLAPTALGPNAEETAPIPAARLGLTWMPHS